MSLADTIASIPFFKGLSPEHLEGLAAIALDRTATKGEVLFSEGDEGTGFYVVASGRVKVFKLSSEGREQILHIFGAGEPFGEVPVFEGLHFPAGAAALEQSRLIFFPRAAFTDLIRRNPDLALTMLAVLSKRLRVFTRLIEDLSLREVPGRVAAYLRYLSHRNEGTQELTLDITKAQLASLLGTIPETLSRILGKMSSRGLIQTKGPRIRILDSEGLKELAEAGGKLQESS